MLDMSNSGEVSYKTYEEFWSNFILMYGQLFNYKVEIDDAAKTSAKKAFNVISDGNESFDFQMFEKARLDNP